MANKGFSGYAALARSGKFSQSHVQDLLRKVSGMKARADSMKHELNSKVHTVVGVIEATAGGALVGLMDGYLGDETGSLRIMGMNAGILAGAVGVGASLFLEPTTARHVGSLAGGALAYELGNTSRKFAADFRTRKSGGAPAIRGEDGGQLQLAAGDARSDGGATLGAEEMTEVAR